MSIHRTGLLKRLAAGFGANIAGKGIVAFIQIASLPIFISHWGKNLYGEWLLLNSIPSYFNLSDLGFGSVASNEMTMLMAKGEQAEALDVFQSVFALTVSISCAIGGIFVAFVWFLPINRWFHFNNISSYDTHLIILMLAISVLLSMQETLFQGAFRCVEKYAYGTFLKSMTQLGNFFCISAVVLLGGNVVQTAAAFCIANGIGTILLWIMLRRNVPWIRIGIRHARIATLRRLFRPAIAFMAFPIGNSLSLQGTLLVVGHVLGPGEVVIFSTARTVTRSVIQFMDIITSSVWPEMSTAVGAGNFTLARSLHRRSCQASIVIAASTIGVLAFVGPAIWGEWTMHKFATDAVLLDLLLSQVFFSSLWYTSFVVLLATNRHQRLAVYYLTATLMSLVIAYPLARFFALRGVAFALVCGDIFLTTYVLHTSLKFLGDSFSGFTHSILSIPRLTR